EVARARAVLRGATPTDRKHRERLLRKLVGRGFSIGVALRAIAPIDPIDPIDPADSATELD
ncbi:MAG: hypothetical protein HY876_04265, partial [Coriobacteriales bacterium]|nr:hypothetical protein [Coriobacteriales bacterium]